MNIANYGLFTEAYVKRVIPNLTSEETEAIATLAMDYDDIDLAECHLRDQTLLKIVRNTNKNKGKSND